MDDFGNGLVLALVSVGLLAPVYCIVKAWLVDRTMDLGLAWLLLTGVILGASAVWQLQGTPWMFAALLFLLVGCVALPFLNWWSDRKALRNLQDDTLEKCHAALRFDPRNATAHVFLADALCARGQYESAIAEYEEALALMPSGEIAMQWRWKLSRALEAEAEVNAPGVRPKSLWRSALNRIQRLRVRPGNRERWQRFLRYSALLMLAFNVLMAIVCAPSLSQRAFIFCLAVIATAVSVFRGAGGREVGR